MTFWDSIPKGVWYAIAVLVLLVATVVVTILLRDSYWRDQIANAPKDTTHTTVPITKPLKPDTVTIVKYLHIREQSKSTPLDTSGYLYGDFAADTTVVLRADSAEVTLPISISASNISGDLLLKMEIRNAHVKFPHEYTTITSMVPVQGSSWWKAPTLVVSSAGAGVAAAKGSWVIAGLVAVPAILTLASGL